jgi:hypothetical protein
LNTTKIKQRFRIKKFILLAYVKSLFYICSIKQQHNIKMHIETLYMVCSKSVPWELDNKDKRIIERHKDLPVSEIVKKLWAAASK